MRKKFLIGIIVLAILGVLAAIYGKKALYYLADLPPDEDEIINCVEPIKKNMESKCDWVKKLNYPKAIFNK